MIEFEKQKIKFEMEELNNYCERLKNANEKRIGSFFIPT